MCARLETWLLVLVAAACTAADSGQHEKSAPQTEAGASGGPTPRLDVDDGKQVSPASEPATVPASPHAKFPSDWRVFVVEPLEVQVGPTHFMSAPASRGLITGERLSRWPIYGAIASWPK